MMMLGSVIQKFDIHLFAFKFFSNAEEVMVMHLFVVRMYHTLLAMAFLNEVLFGGFPR
jgi:hypothetical protein